MTPLLLSKAVGCSVDTAEQWTDALDAAMSEYGIMSRLRAAMFLAQCGHECGSFRWLTELWGKNPTPAQATYEHRLGNKEPGDGFKYRGRGMIQVTGRANYIACRDRLRKRLGARVPDFESFPEKLADPEWAAYSAGDYWDNRDLNTLSDVGNIQRVTQLINGGLNGLADRQLRYQRALDALE